MKNSAAEVAAPKASKKVQSMGYNGGSMVAQRNLVENSIAEVCAGVKKLGFAAFERVRLYGEEFELVSDPFPENDGIAVRVKTKDASPRIVQIPATVLQTVQRRKAA